MPTYEYKREDGTTFEIIQKMNDAPLATCPTTGLQVRRVISGGGGVVYKGDGWYVTDYKDGGKKNKKEASKAEASNTDSKPASKTESSSTTKE